MRASSEPNERLPCPGSASFRAPNFHIARRAVRITGVRGRVPLEFYAVNVQNRHIGARRQAHGTNTRALRSQVARARNPRDELYASIRSCALIYYPCNRGPLSLFPGRAAVSRVVYMHRLKERERKKEEESPAGWLQARA